jgi:ubiquinone/menaquinone biosynthesis C-methylase UbiE
MANQGNTGKGKGSVTAWYEREEFWESMAPKIFSEGHWKNAAAEVDSFIRLLGISPGAKLLDLCCGPGRHALELARRGFHVTAVDRTATYLEQAKERAEQEGLPIEFVLADMRHFRRPGSFDAVLNLYTSFGYFEHPEEDKQVLENVRS